MLKSIALCTALDGCCVQQKVKISTTRELMGNPQQLTKWHGKCDRGEYGHLSADTKDNLRFATRGRSVQSRWKK